MTAREIRDKAREDLRLALINEAYAWRRLGMTIEMSDHVPCPSRLMDDRAVANEAIAVTMAALDAFVTAREEDTRASIAAWIEAALNGDRTLGGSDLPPHFMASLGYEITARHIATSIRKKADREKKHEQI